MEWDVIEVKPEPNLNLFVRFEDGTQGKVRFEPSHLRGVFESASVKEPGFFQQGIRGQRCSYLTGSIRHGARCNVRRNQNAWRTGVAIISEKALVSVTVKALSALRRN